MRIAINTDTRQVVTWAGEALSGIAMTRRDKFPVEIKFISGVTYVALPEGAEARLSLKSVGDYAGGTVAGSLEWELTGEGRNAVYAFFLNLDTIELNALFSAEPESVDMALELEWSYLSGDNEVRLTSVPLQVVVANDYIRDADITPLGAPDGKATEEQARAGEDNETWMTPLRTAQAIEELAASGNVVGVETLADLTDEQIATLRQGSIVTTQDGVRWIYGDSGDARDSASYVVLSDVTPVYDTPISDGVQSVPVGGAPAQAASWWKQKTLVEALDAILFPTLLASVGTARSVSLSVSGVSGVLEVGTTVSRTLTATFQRGTIVNGDGSTSPNPLVGEATEYAFSGTGIAATAQVGNALTLDSVVVEGTNNWSVTVTYDAGSGEYYDNKSNSLTNLDSQRVAGSVSDSSSAPTITGVYPYYYYKSASPITAADMVAAIAGGTATKVVGASTGTLAIPYNISAQYLAVAYPASSTTKTQYYVTALDNGSISAVFQGVQTLAATTLDGSQDYKIHVSTGALTNSNATIELRN